MTELNQDLEKIKKKHEQELADVRTEMKAEQEKQMKWLQDDAMNEFQE